MSPCSARNALISARSRVISVGGISSGNCITNIFSGALRTSRRIVDHERLRMNALEEMRGGDVGEIERRILPQQDDVELGQVDAPRLAEREVVADLVADLERLHRREHPRGALAPAGPGV